MPHFFSFFVIVKNAEIKKIILKYIYFFFQKTMTTPFKIVQAEGLPVITGDTFKVSSDKIFKLTETTLINTESLYVIDVIQKVLVYDIETMKLVKEMKIDGVGVFQRE